MYTDIRYPDSETLSPQFSTIHRTDYIGDFAPYPDIASPYYMGYVDYRDFPRQYNLNQLSGDTTKITFTPVKENHSWGFIGQAGAGTFATGTPQFYGWDNEDHLYIKDTSQDARCYFLNDIIMANVNTLGERMAIEGRGIYIETEYLNEISSNGSFSFYHSNNSRALSFPIALNIDMHKLALVYTDETEKFSYTFDFNGVSKTISFGKADYINDTVMKVIDGDYTCYIVFTRFNFRAVAKYAYGQDPQSGSITILPFYSQTIPEADEGTGLKPQENAVWVPHNAAPTDQRFHYNYFLETFDPVVYQLPLKIGSCIVGNYPLETLTVEDFKEAGFGANYDGLIHETMLIVGMGSVDWGSEHYYNEGFFSQINLDDIWKATMGYHKIYNDPELTPVSTSYSENISTALYQDLDRPLLERENGRYPQDRDFSVKLRDWQIPGAHITVDEYKDSDKPPYDPEPPEPGPSPEKTEDKFTGDNVDVSRAREFTVKGTTYYALTASDFSNFSQLLWRQAKGFYQSIQIAGRQADSIFDFIESIRYYPINWQFATSSTPSSTVYLGTGATFQDFEGGDYQLKKVESGVIETWNIGSWDLKDSTFKWRNNFLDYSPYVKISVYIPYVGIVELDPASIAAFGPIEEAVINLDVSMDISTGCMTFYLTTDGGQVLAERTTKIGIDMHLNGNNATAQASAILSAQFNTTRQVLGSVLAPINSLGQMNPLGTASGIGGAYASIGSAYLENSLAKKQIPVEVQSQGGVASNIYRVQCPYLTVHRQKYSNPENYGHTTGYLVEGEYVIKTLVGFTICRNVDASSIGKATTAEKAQIKQILESGFYA